MAQEETWYEQSYRLWIQLIIQCGIEWENSADCGKLICELFRSRRGGGRGGRRALNARRYHAG